MRLPNPLLSTSRYRLGSVVEDETFARACFLMNFGARPF